MENQRIIFESSPAYILLCLAVGVGYALLLYRTTHPWPVTVNRVLFGLRAVLAFLLAFLLLGPIIRQIARYTEKPLFVILRDNSGSVTEATDSTTLHTITRELDALSESLEEKGYEVAFTDLEGRETAEPDFNARVTDLHGALENVSNRYEGKKFGGVLLVSDGIYNTGISPLFANYKFPVHTLGVGDTTHRTDVAIRNVAFNKLAYQGNKFPVRVEVILKGLDNQRLTVTLQHKGKTIDQQMKDTGDDSFVTYDFQVLADEQGIQKYDLAVDVVSGETNVRNNRATIFVEVVEGKKKIAIVAPSPHPDIKALRTVIEQNSNYELILEIPGVVKEPRETISPEEVDLVIFHQSPDRQGRTRARYNEFMKNRNAAFFILGVQSDLALLAREDVPLEMESMPRDYDEVTPVVNTSFSNFSVSAEANSVVTAYPPVSVPFGKFNFPLSARPLLYQQVGTIPTDKPLLAVEERNGRKIAIMMGEGLWRWRLDEFEQTGRAEGFDELFGKLIQYLSTSDDRRRFRSYPIKQEFSDVEPVVFESQVYDDIFEPVFGNAIDIEVTDDQGKVNRYSYVTSPGNTRYQIGGLSEGVYRYRSQTEINGRNEEVRGQFAVVTQLVELQNLTADFDLLRKLAANTGGRFFTTTNLENLNTDLSQKEATGVIRSEETYNALINLRALFFVLVAIAAVEWFFRKFYGGY
ncbi:MAG: hypothetical protein LOY03_18425 [Cyclobacteriaceae bacterium]|nr:hypothetical protein [Cyclobacteriaceae bacterium]